ncbi:MAG TPA: oxygenase MpaB family protein [Candidatus Limnocylindria bacterium]|nr:oxygenase MpaB family protein [Candidatus Limnocylindria bacterium]
MADHGILPKDAVARSLNRELFLALGSTAAVLLQIAHPLVAAGVDQHSDFRRDAFGRFHRTANISLDAVFADSARARRALRRIDARHATVRGAAADGTPYRARDPQLLLWVQATLVLTSLRWYELVAGRLPAIDRQRYWDEGKVFARELGVPDHLFPPTIGDLERYERDMLETAVIPDPTSREVARVVLHPFKSIPDALYWPSDVITAGLVPAGLRDAFGLRWGRAERFFFRFVVHSLRIWRAAAPTWLAIVPHARLYDERMARAEPGARRPRSRRRASS